MRRSHAIWNQVQACKYNSDKSYGISDTGEVTINVGSSGKNSHKFLEHITTRRFYEHPKYGKVCVFKFSVDGIVLKEMIFTDNDGKAGKHITTRTKLNGIKSLK